MKELSEAKKKELETRALLGPRIPRSTTAYRPPTATPSLGGPRKRDRVGPGHPTRDSGS